MLLPPAEYCLSVQIGQSAASGWRFELCFDLGRFFSAAHVIKFCHFFWLLKHWLDDHSLFPISLITNELLFLELIFKLFLVMLLRPSLVQPPLRALFRCLHSSSHHLQQPKLVLGIETSCDDTGIALLRASDGAILAEVTASQTALHVSNGGIIPPVARDLHRSAIDRCVGECLKTAGGGVSARDLAAVAVTLRPGLSLSLLVGCQYAKKLSAKYHLPVVPIHHMEAHALTAMLQYGDQLRFPFLCLLISGLLWCFEMTPANHKNKQLKELSDLGGHCLIVHVKGLHDFELLGRSIDDAPGDILDKTARALRLKNLGPPYSQVSGGAAVELMARSGNPFSHFERATSTPLYSSRRRTCNFSFSGFLTAITRHIARLEEETGLAADGVLPQAPDICASLLYVLSFTLIKRLQRAYAFLEQRQENDPSSGSFSKRLVVSGGCAANQFIGGMLQAFAADQGLQLFIPRPGLCTDNGVMIAWNGVLKLREEEEEGISPPGAILRDQAAIQQLDIQPKAALGVDITRAVTDAHIKTERIDVKSYVGGLLHQKDQQQQSSKT